MAAGIAGCTDYARAGEPVDVRPNRADLRPAQSLALGSDGPAVAGGGRGGCNQRFGQPGIVGTRYGGFFYPGDIYPFASRSLRDPISGAQRGLLDRAVKDKVVPKIFQINTGYEYWSRVASLVHMTPDGVADAKPMPSERLYHVASAPHFSGPFPPESSSEILPGIFRPSSVDTSAALRAL